MNNNRKELFRLLPLWGGQLISICGSNIVQFALIWYITEKYSSTIVLSVSTIFTYIPAILLGPIIGSIIDKIEKKKIMIFSDLISALATCIFVFLLKNDYANTFFIYMLFFIRSVCNQFQTLASVIAVSNSVEKENLTSAAGVNLTINGISNFVAPIVGAILLKVWSIDNILLLEIVTALFAILCLCFFRVNEIIGNETKEKNIIEQFKTLKVYKDIFQYSIFIALLNLCMSPSITILPLLVSSILKKDVSILAIIEASYVIGMIVGGLIVGLFKNKSNYHNRIIVSAFLYSILFLVFGILLFFQNINLFIYYILLFLVGNLFSIFNSNITAFFQNEIPKEEQGVMFGTISAVNTAVIPIGLVIEIVFTKITSVQYWYSFAGLLMLIFCVLFSIKANKKINQNNVQVS